MNSIFISRITLAFTERPCFIFWPFPVTFCNEQIFSTTGPSLLMIVKPSACKQLCCLRTVIHCARLPSSLWTNHKRRTTNVADEFHTSFLIEHSNGRNGACGSCFYPNFAMVVHPKTCPCLLQLTVLSLPLFSFLKLLKPVLLCLLVPWVRRPSVILSALSSQFSSVFHHLSSCSVTFQLLSVLSLHPLAFILSLSFSFPSPVSPGSSFSVWLLSACVVGVKSLFDTGSICTLSFFVPW